MYVYDMQTNTVMSSMEKQDRDHYQECRQKKSTKKQEIRHEGGSTEVCPWLLRSFRGKLQGLREVHPVVGRLEHWMRVRATLPG